MLKNIVIKNFRLFDNFKIDNLAPVNLIVGKNNVGKSSLLEAIYLLVNQNRPESLLRILKMRGEYSTEGKSREGYKIAHLFLNHTLKNEDQFIIQANNHHQLSIKGTFKAREQTSKRSNAKLSLVYKGTSIETTELDVLEGLIDDHPVYRRELDYSSFPYITTQGFNYNQLATLWDKITLTPKEDNVTKMLQILQPDVERINFKSSTHNYRKEITTANILVKRKGHPKPFLLGSMGEGMQRILSIAIALANAENGVLLVDEIDTGLHYRTISDMWNLVLQTAKNLKVQVFATTHSWDCIASFAEALTVPGNEEAGKLFRLEARGDTIASVPYSNEELTTATEQHIEVR